MTTANWCVFIAFIIPYVLVTIAKAGAKGYDNQQPRVFANTLTGMRARAYWSHLNGFEVFAPFAAAVVLAEINGVQQPTVDLLAMSFIAFRIAHGVLYITNHDRWRFIAWFGGFVATVGLFLLIPSANL
jgi:uncharacterized MAPEG superfamily protein